jgi:hypothetical protein
MEEKDIFKYLENEVRAFNTLKAAQKAYQDDLEEHLKNEIRAQQTLNAAETAYEKNLEEHLRNEVQARQTLDAAKDNYNKRPVIIPWGRYIASAAAACFIGVLIFTGIEADYRNTCRTGEEMLAAYSFRDGSSIDQSIESKEYEQALTEIEDQLKEIPDLETLSGEVREAKLLEYNRLMEQKAIVLLLMGEHRKAKAVLKQLDTPEAQKALDSLWW